MDVPTFAFSSPIANDRFGGLNEILLILLLQTGIYLILSFYFELAVPSAHGITLPFYFPFLPSFWSSSQKHQQKTTIKNNANLDPDLENSNKSSSQKQKNSADIEMIETDRNKAAGISLRKLTKCFGTGKSLKTVVDNLTVDFYENEITGFLGHNGAGKSTVRVFLLKRFPLSALNLKIFIF